MCYVLRETNGSNKKYFVLDRNPYSYVTEKTLMVGRKEINILTGLEQAN